MKNAIRLVRFRSHKQIEADAYERCILCWQLTDVPKSTPISLRSSYIEGQGQLCRNCSYKLFKGNLMDWQRAL